VASLNGGTGGRAMMEFLAKAGARLKDAASIA
jgi:hypothetical protein